MTSSPTPAPQGQNYEVVDGLRALSIILVVVYHSFMTASQLLGKELFEKLIRETPIFMRWVWHGDKGVDVFFVISGFLISSMLFKEYKASGDIRLGNFYWRRMVRLAPIYWVALLMFYPFLGNQHTIWANFLYINNFLPAEEMFMGWSWSLAVEEQFYLIFPVCILYLFPKFRSTAWALVGLIILAMLIRFLIHLMHPELNNFHPSQFMFPSLEGFSTQYFDVIYSNLYSRFGVLACGCLVGYLHVYHREALQNMLVSKQKQLGYLFLFCFASLFLITAIPHYNPDTVFTVYSQTAYSVLHRNVFGIAISVVLLLTLYPIPWSKFLVRFLSLPFWKFIARLSYSMYLFHLVVVIGVTQIVTQQLGGQLGEQVSDITLNVLALVWGNTFIIFVLTVLVSCVAYYAVERPIMNLRKPAEFHA